jgi:hypothetical protein
MVMLTHDGRRIQADRSVTKGSALGAAGHDSNVLGHNLFTFAPLETFGTSLSPAKAGSKIN